MGALRSLAAFVLPALAGISLLLCTPLLGHNRARNLATRTIGAWGCRLAGIRLRIEDPHGLAGCRPAVFVFNHQSGVDPVVLCALLQGDVVGVAKRELRRHPLLGPLLSLAGTVFVDRQAAEGSKALAPAREALKRGLAIAMAPEGHRRRKLGKLHPGAVRLARDAQVPLIPVIIHDSARVLAPGEWLMRPATIHVQVLPALPLAQLTLERMEATFHAHLPG